MTNWMAGFADLLMPDPAARMAIDETIQDYCDERAQASSGAARLWSDVQCVVALGRVLMLTAVRDLVARDTWRVVASCLVLSVAVMPVFVLPTWTARQVVLTFPSGTAFFVLTFATLAFGPIAAIGLFERADRPVRIAGPLVASALLTLVVMGWLIPAAGQSLRVAQWVDVAGGRAIGSNLLPGPRELDLPSLIRRSWNDSWNLAFSQALVLRVAFILVAPTGLLLGAALRRRWRHRVNWRVLQLSGFVAAIAIIVSVGLGHDAWSMNFVRGRGLSLELVGLVWLPIFVAWMATIALVRWRQTKIFVETS